MLDKTIPAPLAFTLGRGAVAAVARALILAGLIVAGMLASSVASAQDATNPSGLPLPRFATTRSTPINVRVGPGTRYGVAWVYVKAGTPVEIVKEFDTWRKIRDVDGSEGWVHQNLLSGKRAGIAAPWKTEAQIPLLSGRGSEGVRAWLGPGFRVDIAGCDGAWCEVSATAKVENATSTYSGYLPQTELWGVYQGEEFD
jgi:SH3-like domain-containing protein